MNINPNDFWDMTMREYVLKQRGYLHALEDQQIHDWNQLRVMACYVLKPHLKKGSKISPTDIMSLPIDKTKKQIDQEQARKDAILFDMKVKKSEAKNKDKEKEQVTLADIFAKNKK